MGKIQNTVCYPARLLCRDLKRIRVAVAGLGKMGTYHAQAVQRLARGEAEDYYKSGLDAQTIKLALCGLCDPCAEKAEAVASDIPWFADWQELLASCKPDLAIIASPTQTHFELAVHALEAGVHTFVEKPLVTKLDEFKQLNQIASEQGCRLMSGHVERYNPVAIKLRAMLAEKQLVADGYRFQRTQPHDARIADDIVTDKIVHDLDLAQYFFGVITDYRLLDSKRTDGCTQEATVWLRHANGIEGTLFVSWLLSDGRKCREVRITCKGGSVAIGDFASKELKVDKQPISCAVPSWVKPDNNQIKDELADFVAYCLIPDPALPRFEPLLQLAEIERSIEIIENLIQQTG
jgi:UDP-N-acetylglucosamine 3-dehydrogenase